MKELFFVFIGGGTGSVMRFIASMLWQHISLHPRFADTVMPWPTLIVNILGCFLISVFYKYSGQWGLTPETRLLLTTGLCGGFTTFSALSYEGMTLLREGYFGTYFLYITLSIVLGLLAAILPLAFK
ncbi:MAG: CrcB family protein [Bacteroidales bacterium]|nr:CrcB family protein [Bacteroidales bacterium]MCM1148116.1 CrcB family protein [Bacteroidales bacterium]MCM1206532.1 CrcB family protein [Bacillota bacterium]MCM1510566.1 CrcB family protein [Clostridium sp.]